MALELEYKCTRCNRETPRDELTVKKSVFLEMGERARTLRSRVVGWLCPPCIVDDSDWQRPPHRTQNEGGMQSLVQPVAREESLA